MVIADLMSRNVATCKADDRLAAAARLMWDLDVGCVPIVDDRSTSSASSRAVTRHPAVLPPTA